MRITIIRLLPIALSLTFPLFANHHEKEKSEHSESISGDTSLFIPTFMGNYEFTTGHVIQLAEAIPADKYAWSPSEGIRSVEKAILHIAAANYMLGSKLGATLPEGVNPMAIESEDHDKDAAIAALQESIDFAKSAIKKLPPEKLSEEVDLFGMQLNKMSVVLIIGGHANEHLGQLIAYARSNNITPPWSQ